MGIQYRKSNFKDRALQGNSSLYEKFITLNIMHGNCPDYNETNRLWHRWPMQLLHSGIAVLNIVHMQKNAMFDASEIKLNVSQKGN